LKILFLSSEISPFFRDTEQGDACEYLTKALKYQGHDVRVIAPRNKGYGMGKYALREIARLKSLIIKIKDSEYECSVKSGFLPGSRAQVYFIEYPELYNRKEVYKNPETGKIWDDSLLRYSFLNHSALQLLLHLQWLPDVIHCLDWRMSLLPYIINNHEDYKTHFSSTRTMLQLHNYHRSDVFSLDDSAKELLTSGDIPKKFIQENSNGTAWLTTGINCVDQLLYLGEDSLDKLLETDSDNEFAKKVILDRSEDTHKIPFGIDTKNWDPAGDKQIAHRYNIDNFFDTKTDNKGVLRDVVELSEESELPIIAISCLTSNQREIEIVTETIGKLSNIESQFILLGEHDYDWNSVVSKADPSGKNIIAVNDPIEKLKHQIIAGADILLIPCVEKCGCFNQMHGLRYGTIPVVYKDHHASSNIIDADEFAEDGNGFSYTEYTSDAIITVLGKALKLFESSDLWYNIQSNAMSLDLNWKRSVNIMIDIYQQAKDNPKH